MKAKITIQEITDQSINCSLLAPGFYKHNDILIIVYQGSETNPRIITVPYNDIEEILNIKQNAST